MRWLLLTLLLICMPVLSQEETTFDAPPKSVQADIEKVFEQLFDPEIEIAMNEDMEELVIAVNEQLKPLLNDNPEWVAWLATTEFDTPYYYHLEFMELREFLVDHLGEIPGGVEQLYKLATNSSAMDDGQYDLMDVQSNAIRTLGRKQATDELEQLMTPLLKQVSYQPGFINDGFDAYLRQLAYNQIHSTLPELQRVQTVLEHFIKQGSEDALAYQYYISEAIELLTITRAALGDTDVLVATIKLSFDQWNSTSEFAKTALESLILQLGEMVVLEYLQAADTQFTSRQNHYRLLSLNHDDKWVRNWALERYMAIAVANESINELIGVLLNCLDDESWYVQMAAAQQLIKMGESTTPDLYKAFAAAETPLKAKYVLLYVLASLKEDVEPMMEAVEEAYVPLPAFITPPIRRAIISKWGGYTEAETDFRWLTESLLITPTEIKQAQRSYPAEQRIQSLAAAFTDKDIEVDDVVNYADIMQQGRATFTVVKMVDDETSVEIVASKDRVDLPGEMVIIDGEITFVTSESEKDGQRIISSSDWINVSELGPFVFYERASKTRYADADASPSDIEASFIASSSHGMRPDEMFRADKYREIVAKQNFIWLSKQQLEFTIPDLNIYFFGERESLPVKDLLFYWQD